MRPACVTALPASWHARAAAHGRPGPYSGNDDARANVLGPQARHVFGHRSRWSAISAPDPEPQCLAQQISLPS